MEEVFRKHNLLLESILDGASDPSELPISLLEHMTDNFSDERVAGRGGYGVVYKGEFKNRIIAVKKLTINNEDDKDFDREIDSLMRVRHANIVRFLGYCNNIKGTFVNVANPGEPERCSFLYKQERILCFEYINNGSLTDHIQDELRGLEWHTRYKIIKEICLALNYLHNTKNLVHRDLKPDNILIDDNWVPKIADLGISKFLGDGKTQTKTTSGSMSLGYAAPEFRDRVVSYKYDIYSLGVIIIEIVTGVTKTPDVKNVLTRWRHRWNRSNETLRYQQVKKCIEIGMSCKNEEPRKRPSILKIIKDLSDVDGCNVEVAQDMPSWNSLLWVEPPELFFPFQINKQISSSLELHNEADAHMAFFIRTYNDSQYHVDPIKGVIQPRSSLSVSITLLAQEEAPEKDRNAAEFTIKSKKVDKALTHENITKDIFKKKLGNIADKVTIGVVFNAQLRAACFISEESRKDFSLAPLEISGSQEIGETSFEAESSMHSLSDHDKKVIFSDEHDKKQYTNTNDSTIQSGKVTDKVSDEEPTIAPPDSDAGSRPTPTTEPGRLVHLAIKSNSNAPLLRHRKGVMLEMTGGDYTGDRPGLDLVAVLYIGRRIGHRKLEQTKAAMRSVVRKLSPIDRLSVVTFSSEGRRLCPLLSITQRSRQELLELIDSIKFDSPMTNIQDGLVAGLKVLAERERSDSGGRVAAVILMCGDNESSGRATEVSVGDVPVHAFAFGYASAGRVLSAVAANSPGGTYSQVAETDGALTKAFSQCLAGLFRVSVQDLELRVAAVGGESRLVETSAGSYPQRYTQHSGDGHGSSVALVRFGSLYSCEVRRVIVDLLLPAIESERSADILKVACSYSTRSSSGSWEQLVASPETFTVWRTSMELEEEEENMED